MIADTYVILRWTDGALSVTGWGLVVALTLIFAYSLWTAVGK
jgi:hypothetical protein